MSVRVQSQELVPANIAPKSADMQREALLSDQAMTNTHTVVKLAERAGNGMSTQLINDSLLVRTCGGSSLTGVLYSCEAVSFYL